MKKFLSILVLIHGTTVFIGSTLTTVARTSDDLFLAGLFDSLSLDIRLTQIESLLQFYRRSPDKRYLKEAIILAEDLKKLYPGNAQAWAVLASVKILAAAHDVIDLTPEQTLFTADEAIRYDPLSIQALETKMFFLSAARKDQPEFKRLGIRRASLTKKPLRMVCPLCERHWLTHRLAGISLEVSSASGKE